LAVGDALGTTLEFEARDLHGLVQEMTGGGWLALEPGVWTDDTALALALGHALLNGGSILDPAALAREFVAYMQEGKHHPSGRCIDIGGVTASALRAFLSTGEPVGPEGDHTSGNGSLMRLAPVAVVARGDKLKAAELARSQSRVTHASAACLDACECLALVLVEGIETGDRCAALDACSEQMFGHPDVQALARGAWADLSRDDVSSGGYVIDTLCAALWCVGTTNTFEDALVLAVNLAGDADTTGAVAGMLAGSIYGVSGIPQRWLRPLVWRSEIEEMARQLATIGCES